MHSSWNALPLALLFSACAQTARQTPSLQQQLQICERHKRLEITRTEAVQQLGLPPLSEEEANGGIAGWLGYCRELKARLR